MKVKTLGRKVLIVVSRPLSDVEKLITYSSGLYGSIGTRYGDFVRLLSCFHDQELIRPLWTPDYATVAACLSGSRPGGRLFAN